MTDEERQAAEKAEKEAKLKADIEAGICDEHGVPWKNRAKEEARKREEVQEELNAIKTTPPPAPEEKKEEDEWTKQQREIAKEELQKEEQSKKTMKSILDNIEEKNPRVKKYRAEIENRMSAFSTALRTNPNSVMLYVNAVLGEHLDDIVKDNTTKPDDPADSGRRLVTPPSSEVLTPTPGPNVPSVIELTDDEIAYGNRNHLFDPDKGFTNAEIREMYKKRQEKLGKKK